MRIAIGLVVSLISIQAQVAQPTDVEGWKSRGFGLLGAGHLQEAAAAYERATNLKPNDPGAHLWLGSAYMLMSFGAPSPRNVANVFAIPRAAGDTTPRSSIACSNWTAKARWRWPLWRR